MPAENPLLLEQIARAKILFLLKIFFNQNLSKYYKTLVQRLNNAIRTLVQRLNNAIQKLVQRLTLS